MAQHSSPGPPASAAPRVRQRCLSSSREVIPPAGTSVPQLTSQHFTEPGAQLAAFPLPRCRLKCPSFLPCAVHTCGSVQLGVAAEGHRGTSLNAPCVQRNPNCWAKTVPALPTLAKNSFQRETKHWTLKSKFVSCRSCPTHCTPCPALHNNLWVTHMQTEDTGLLATSQDLSLQQTCLNEDPAMCRTLWMTQLLNLSIKMATRISIAKLTVTEIFMFLPPPAAPDTSLYLCPLKPQCCKKVTAPRKWGSSFIWTYTAWDDTAKMIMKLGRSEGDRACLLVEKAKCTRTLAFPSCTNTDLYLRVSVVKEVWSVTQHISFT